MLPKTKFGYFYGRKRHKVIAEDYQHTARILDHYRTWFRFTSTHEHAARADHVVVCLSDPVKLYTVGEWEEMVQHIDTGPPS